MESKVLVFEKEGQIAWLKLNRPEKLNSLNKPLLEALLEACETIKQDKSIRIAIIIGSGGRAFCAGADLAERKGMTEAQVVEYHTLIQKTFQTIDELPIPTIAALNSSAFGGGVELALSCDLRIMVEDSIFRLTEVRLGIIPGAGGTQRLPRLIGKSKAKEMILTTKALTAKEAHEIGLVHRIIPGIDFGDDKFHFGLTNNVRSWAKEIIQAAPLSLEQAKYAIDSGYDCDLNSGLAIETQAYLKLLNTEDRLEGLKAFAEKREPVYQGK